jgi:hypothetical protein
MATQDIMPGEKIRLRLKGAQPYSWLDQQCDMFTSDIRRAGQWIVTGTDDWWRDDKGLVIDNSPAGGDAPANG